MMNQAILMVEDNEEDAIMVREALRNAGVKNSIHTVTDGDLAIAYLKGEGAFADRDKFPVPSILLLDLKMPRVSGFQVMEWLRAQERFRKLLIVVLSGYNELREVQQAYRLGAHSFLIKPCTAQDIENLMRWFAEHWEVGTESVPRRRR